MPSSNLSHWAEALVGFFTVGGVLMPLLFAVSCVVFGSLFGFWLGIGFVRIKDKTQGTFEAALNQLKDPHFSRLKSLGEIKDQDHLMEGFERWRFELFGRYAQSIKVTNYLIVITPLIGLLGTVLGMIYTFKSLGKHTGSGLMLHITKGISEALITTQTGLIIAIFGFVVLAVIKERIKKVKNETHYLEVLAVRQLNQKALS